MHTSNLQINLFGLGKVLTPMEEIVVLALCLIPLSVEVIVVWLIALSL